MKIKLYRPLRGDLVISQNWLENNVCINDEGKTIPRVTPICPEGYVSLYTKFGLKGHNGLDLPALRWTPIYSTLEGTVTEVQTEPERGLGVSITSDNTYEWTDAFSNASGDNQIKHRYWHLAGINVKMGQKVKIGDVIGWVDSTGLSTADHLHYEIKPVLNGANVLQNNGMFGAIDPLPHMDLNVSASNFTDLLAKLQVWVWHLGDLIKNIK